MNCDVQSFIASVEVPTAKLRFGLHQPNFPKLARLERLSDGNHNQVSRVVKSTVRSLWFLSENIVEIQLSKTLSTVEALPANTLVGD